MKKLITAGLGFVMILTGAAILAAAVDESKKNVQSEEFKMPEPQKEHKWLQQMVGQWDADIEVYEPNKPVQKSKGSESVRMIGGFWMLAEDKGMVMDKPFTGILTIGYDTDKKKYVATWVDSMNNYLWKYEGTVDEDGDKLTLLGEGPCPRFPGKILKFKHTLELKSKDDRVYSSYMQEEDGKWTPMVTIHYRLKR
jgi:Protein of unknown function (DUF1579)